MHQLTAREAELLAAESATNLGHTALMVELDTGSTKGPEVTLDWLRDRMTDRLHLLPGFRRRVYRVPMNLDRPWWLEDPNFDLDYHLRHVGVPGSDDDGLASLIARLHERPLDRSRPLWEMYLIDRTGENPVLFVKMHHVLVDGVTGLDVLAPLVDGVDIDHDDVPVKNRSDRLPEDSDLLIKAGWSMAKSPWRMVNLAARGISAVPVLGRVNVLGPLAPWATPGGAVEVHADQAAPRVSFNRTIGPHRRVAFASLPVEAVKDLHQKHDVRFNDVILALVAGTLRHWLVLHDELPSEPLVALSPVLVDSVDEPLGTALVPLATHRHEPIERLLEIAEATALLTDDLEAKPVEAIRSMYEAAPAVASLASRLMVRTGAFTRLMPPFNVYVVNVPGGGEAPTVDGIPLAHQFPLSTLVDGTGLSVSVMSQGETVDFSFVADRDLVPDLQDMAERLPVELEILAGRRSA